jgi:hypothetical protein
MHNEGEPAGGPAEAAVESNAQASFPGDTGELAPETRRVLVQLLLGPSVDGRRHPRLWPVLQRDEAILRKRLHELFLTLEVDHDQKVAFIRQVVADSVEIPILLRRAQLTFLESALLLFVRHRLTQADAQGERAVVAYEEMVHHLQVFKRADNPDHARFERLSDNAVEKAKKLGILNRIRGTEQRYEVSPTLKLLFSAEDIQALTRIYERLCANETEVPVDDAPLLEDEEGEV